MIEKQGEPIQENSFYVPDRSNEKKRIPILDIISVPHLDNISFGFSVDDYKISSAYNPIIDKLSDELAKGLHYTEEVKNEKIRQIEEMDSSWLYLTSFLCFNSEDVKNNEAYSEYRLSRIREYVKKQFSDKRFYFTRCHYRKAADCFPLPESVLLPLFHSSGNSAVILHFPRNTPDQDWLLHGCHDLIGQFLQSLILLLLHRRFYGNGI